MYYKCSIGKMETFKNKFKVHCNIMEYMDRNNEKLTLRKILVSMGISHSFSLGFKLFKIYNTWGIIYYNSLEEMKLKNKKNNLSFV
jgi:hypothetical protein